MTKVHVVGVQPLIGPVFNAYLDEDVVFLSCGHSITLEPHEDDNLSLVGTETECEEAHRHSPTQVSRRNTPIGRTHDQLKANR